MKRQLKDVILVYFKSYKRYRSFIGLFKKLKIKAGKLKANISERNTLNKREIQIYTKQKNLFNIYRVQVQESRQLAATQVGWGRRQHQEGKEDRAGKKENEIRQ